MEKKDPVEQLAQTVGASYLVEQLELIVDASSLLHVLTALELMCYAKEEHINVNWQDRATAKSWERDGRMINSILEKIQN